MQNNQSMYKIYSRNRIKIFPKKNRHFHNRKKAKKLLSLLIIIIISILSYLAISKSIDPIFETICSDEAQSIATKITNEQSTRAIQDYTYDEMFTIERDNSGNIQMITANIFVIDEITSNIANYIQDELNNIESPKIKLSVGSFSGIKILSGVGPKIKIKISPTGKVETDLRSEFISQGINQTIHRIYLQIDCTVNILTPFKTIRENISNQILLTENVIIGNIPSNYYNFDGITDAKDALEIIE